MSKVSVYLSHNYAAKEWLNNVVVPVINAIDPYEVRARWLTQGHYSLERTPEKQRDWAIEDFEDSSTCFIFVHFVNQTGETPGKGKYIELGVALAVGVNNIILVGDIEKNESIFYHHPNVDYVFPDISALITFLKKGAHHWNQ